MSLFENLNNLEISIINAKQTLVNNINNKGGEASVDDTLTEIADKVLDIPTTGGGSGDCPSALDFSIIGYDTTLSDELNAKFNADIAYSKTLYDAWNPNNTSANKLYQNDIQLVYAPNIDTSNVTNMNNMFYGCKLLTLIPQFNTSTVTDMYNMFYNCSELTTVPQFDTSNVTTMSYMFANCKSLTSIPQFDTSKVSNMSYMFNSCTSLTSIPLLDTSNVTNIMIFGYGTTKYNNLTELGGFRNLKIDWSVNYGLYQCPNLTYESVMNVINNLYDFRGNGDDTTTRTLKLNANSLALLSDDDKAIATSKGWTLS